MSLSDSKNTKTGRLINYSMPAPEGFNFDKPDQWPLWIRRFDRYREQALKCSEISCRPLG